MKGHLRTAVVAALIGACAAAATVAVAGTGIGGVFNLGQTNSVDATSRLQGASSSGAQLAVTNTSTAGAALGLNVTNNSANSPAILATNNSSGNGVQATSTGGFAFSGQTASSSLPALRATNTGGFPAASFVVNSGVAPFRVNSVTKVIGLNADYVDGKDASQIGALRAYAHVANGSLDASRSSGVTSWAREYTSGVATYCFTLSFTPVTAATSVGYTTFVSVVRVSPPPEISLASDAQISAAGCPAGTNAAASISEGEADGFSSFYVVFN